MNRQDQRSRGFCEIVLWMTSRTGKLVIAMVLSLGVVLPILGLHFTSGTPLETTTLAGSLVGGLAFTNLVGFLILHVMRRDREILQRTLLRLNSEQKKH